MKKALPERNHVGLALFSHILIFPCRFFLFKKEKEKPRKIRCGKRQGGRPQYFSYKIHSFPQAHPFLFPQIINEKKVGPGRNEILLEKQENLSSITVKLPKDNVNVPGIYYFIFQRLSWEGINIYEVISTTNEFTILINDDQVDKAFTVIKNLKSLQYFVLKNSTYILVYF